MTGRSVVIWKILIANKMYTVQNTCKYTYHTDHGYRKQMVRKMFVAFLIR